MKGFIPDMLVQQLKEKCKISYILSIKYMDRDKDWIDHRCCDFDSFVYMVESAEIIPDRRGYFTVRITLKVCSNRRPLSQSHDGSTVEMQSRNS
jgi:hypothetical protein